MPRLITGSGLPPRQFQTESNGHVLPPFVHDYLASGAQEGTRNETIYRVAQQFMAAKLPQSEAERRILARALVECPNSEAGIRQTIASAYKSTKVVEPLEIARTVVGNPTTKPKPKPLGFLDALKAAFKPGETVAVVESRQNDDGDWKPSVATLKTLEGWEKWHDKLGTIDKLNGRSTGGMFIGINPYKSGSDRRSNDNVAVFRHVLAEWDDLPAAEQHERLVTSGLPLSVIVTSGGKSVHGWVRVDADDKATWEARRDAVHKLLGCDVKNKDLARVSRCPGAHRGDVEQKVLAVNVGPKSWAEYEQKSAWVPKSWGIFDLVERGPEPPPEVIVGVLRRSCHLQISSGAKMRKSYALIDLALSVAFGLPWMGLETVAGPVFYADAENQAALIRQRIPNIATARGITLTPEHNDLIKFSPLRGTLRGRTLPEIVAGVTRSIEQMPVPPVLAILEPLYLLLRGAKENEAEEVTAALEELDAVCTSVGCAVVYVHHFSKGNQSLKKSMDRASGSGALSRYPDAIMTLNPPPDEVKKGEDKPDYDAMVELTTRWFPPRQPFPVWWRNGHYAPEKTSRDYRVQQPKDDSTAGRYGHILKEMPPLMVGDVPEWVASHCKLDLVAAKNVFGTLRSGAYSGLFVVHVDGKWQGVNYDDGDPF